MHPTGYPVLDSLLLRLDAVAGLDAPGLDAERIAVLGRKQGALTAAMKRFKKTGTRKLKRWHANHTHILTKKTRKRKNRLKKGDLVSSADYPRVSRLLQA